MSDQSSDADFDGALPEGLTRRDCGVPWEWASICYAPPDLRQARIEFEKLISSPGRAPRPQFADSWDPYEQRQSAPKTGDVGIHGQSSPGGYRIGVTKDGGQLARREAEHLREALRSGKLRGIGTPLRHDRALRWIPRRLWLEDYSHIPGTLGGHGSLRFLETHEVWSAPCVIDLEEGIPLSLAVIGFAPFEASRGMTSLSTPDHLANNLRQSFAQDLASGRFIITGIKGKQRTEIGLPRHAAEVSLEGDKIVWPASAGFSCLRVKLGSPWGPESKAAQQWTSGREARAIAHLIDWLTAMDAAEQGTQSKALCKRKLLGEAEFKRMPGNAFDKRIWPKVRAKFPSLKMPGRKPKPGGTQGGTKGELGPSAKSQDKQGNKIE